MPSVESTAAPLDVIPSRLSAGGSWNVTDLEHRSETRQSSAGVNSATDLPYTVTEAIPLAILLGKAKTMAEPAPTSVAAEVAASVGTDTDIPSNFSNGPATSGTVVDDKAQTATSHETSRAPIELRTLPVPVVPIAASPARTEAATPIRETAPDDKGVSATGQPQPSASSATAHQPVPPVPAVPLATKPALMDMTAKGSADQPRIVVSRLTNLIAEQKLILDQLAQATSQSEVETPRSETEAEPSANAGALSAPSAPSHVSGVVDSSSHASVETAMPLETNAIASDKPSQPPFPTIEARRFEYPLQVESSDDPPSSEEPPRQLGWDAPRPPMASLDDLARAFASPTTAAAPSEASSHARIAPAIVSAPPPSPVDRLVEPIAPHEAEPLPVHSDDEWSVPSRVPGFLIGLALSMVAGIVLWITVLR